MHNNSFTLNIDVARCFVKYIDGLVRNKVYGKRKPLFLTARNICAVLGYLLVKSAVLTDKIGKVHFFECVENLIIGDIFFCKPEILTDGRIEDICIVADDRKL